MKKPRAFFYTVLSAIVLLSAFVLIEHQKRTAKKEQQAESMPSDNDSNPATNLTNPPMPAALGKIISDTITSSNRTVIVEKDGMQRMVYIPTTLASTLTKEQILATLAYTNPPFKPSTQKLNERLIFYGVAVDDETNALAGVTVSGGVLVVDGQNPSQTIPVNTISGGDGRFQVDVDYGQLIWLTVSKGTNYISPPSRQFKYGPGGYGPRDSETISHPDANDPIVFVLTKKKEPEPLIEIRKGMTALNTGEPVRIDLTTGQIMPTGGDLIVSITCLEPYKAGVHIPWRLVLQATDGGFISTGDQRLENMLQAPESGYDEIIIEYPKDDPDWSPQYFGTLYLKSRNGQIFGKLNFDMHTRWDERGVPFGFHSFVNTNGSRNLQGISQ